MRLVSWAVCAYNVCMKDAQAGPRRRMPTNVSLDPSLISEARELGVNISQASARGLEQALAEARAERWLAENRAALEEWNIFADQHGLPLSAHRQF